MSIDISKIKQEDIIKFIIEYLKNKEEQNFKTYGYDLYLPKVMERWLIEKLDESERNDHRKYFPDVSAYFYDASWELSRLGVLRPGIIRWNEQSTNDGSTGNGYSLTPFGRQWIVETDMDNFVPTEPGRFSEMLAPYVKSFGAVFYERAQQAIRCYGAHTYLACCVMCGASVESILLNLAIKKQGNEDEVLKKYRASNGRSELEKMIIGQQKERIKKDFEICFSLLKYWRDESAHGRKSDIAENEAFTSLALLLLCCKFASDNYELLTVSSN